ncbi:hypothetical protein RZS28_03225 [Methylocapsa polymorpha]|uniref:Uncharacterized protein n=1 Tax=Methylocapsa polymorpha TaxID=3080828 RepID=A0ABZ0HTT2_9HYPH|nr:hypothetical protein RZS28_03225 [Methylocapsa sp. RX1]
MRRLTSLAAAAAFMAGASGLGGSAQAGPFPNAGAGMPGGRGSSTEKAQFFWGGYNYCWYGNAWNGPRLVLVRLSLAIWLWLGRRLWLERLGAAGLAAVGAAVPAAGMAAAFGAVDAAPGTAIPCRDKIR